MTYDVAAGYFLTYLKSQGASLNTRKAYKWDLTHWIQYTKSRSITVNETTLDQIMKFIDAYEKSRKSPASVNRMKATLNKLFGYLYEAGHIQRLPFQTLKYERVVRRAPRGLKAEERTTLEGIISFRKDLYLLLLLYLGHGLRLSEALGLDVDDVEGQETIRVVGKRRKVRYLNISSELKKALGAWLPERDKILGQSNRYSERVDRKAIFINQWGSRLSPRRAQQLMRSRFDQAGLSRLTIHGLRHAFAKQLQDLGVDIRTIQEILGHANVTTTQIYTNVTREDVRRAMEKVSQAREKSNQN